MIEIKMLKKVKLEGCTFIEGFPGVGLVGPMSISYMVDKLKMKYIGYVESPSFPPLVSIHKSEPMPPLRLYYSDTFKLVTIFAEFAIPIEMVAEMGATAYAFIRKSGMKRIYSIGGIPINAAQGSSDKKGYAVASTAALSKNIQDAGLKLIQDGVSTGIGATLLLKSTIDQFENINIMVPVQQAVPDPIYAENAIAYLNKLLKLKIDISDLDKEAKEVEAKIRELMNKHKESHEGYKRAAAASGGGGSEPPMYA